MTERHLRVVPDEPNPMQWLQDAAERADRFLRTIPHELHSPATCILLGCGDDRRAVQ